VAQIQTVDNARGLIAAIAALDLFEIWIEHGDVRSVVLSIASVH